MDFSMTDFYVLAILEGVIAIQYKILDADVFSVYKEIVSFIYLHIVQFHIPAIPECFQSIGQLYIFEFDSVLSRNIFGASTNVSFIFRFLEYQSAARAPSVKRQF